MLSYQDVFILIPLRPHRRLGHFDSSSVHKSAHRGQMNTMELKISLQDPEAQKPQMQLEPGTETPDPVPDPLEPYGDVSSSGQNYFIHLYKSAL